MKRTKTSEEIWWRKIGGGSLHIRIGGRMRIIKENQKFQARPEEISDTFRDVILPMNKEELVKVEKEQGSIDVTKLEYTVKSKGGGWYDVVSSDGKTMNEKALREDGAAKLIESLTA